HLINVGQDLLQHSRWGRRVDCDAGALAELLDALNGAMQILVAFPVNEKRIGASLDKLIEEKGRGRDHHVRLEVQPRYSSERPDVRHDHRYGGIEVTIQDVDMNSLGASLRRLGYSLAQTGEVRCEDRRCNLNGVPLYFRAFAVPVTGHEPFCSPV